MTLETEFAEVLEVIATSLGIAAERVFGIFVNAQATIGILSVLGVLFAVVSGCVAWWYTRKIIAAHGTDNDGEWRSDATEVDYWVAPVFVAIVAFVLVWALAAMVDDSILRILCPEYTAMREIIELVR